MLGTALFLLKGCSQASLIASFWLPHRCEELTEDLMSHPPSERVVHLMDEISNSVSATRLASAHHSCCLWSAFRFCTPCSGLGLLALDSRVARRKPCRTYSPVAYHVGLESYSIPVRILGFRVSGQVSFGVELQPKPSLGCPWACCCGLNYLP